MKSIFTTFIFVLVAQLSFAQFQFDKAYASKSEDGSTKYLKVHSDGLILMVNTKDEYSKVKEYFNRDSDENDYVILYKSQSKIKDGSKASFVLENDGNKINCIAQGQGDKITLVMLSPSSGKQQSEFTLVVE
jgi:hypothetical protein